MELFCGIERCLRSPLECHYGHNYLLAYPTMYIIYPWLLVDCVLSFVWDLGGIRFSGCESTACELHVSVDVLRVEFLSNRSFMG